MKATLHFELPREKEEFELALNSKHTAKVLDEILMGLSLREENEILTVTQIREMINKARGVL